MKKITLLLGLLLLLSCSDDKDDIKIVTAIDIDLVTGLHIRNSEDSDVIRLGNPNVWNNNQFILYPNPPTGILNLSASENITDVWIVPANGNKTYEQTNFNLILNSKLYSEPQIESAAELQFSNMNSTNAVLNLNNLTPGYYKVFVKITDNLYWENIYIPGNNFEIVDLFNYWN